MATPIRRIAILAALILAFAVQAQAGSVTIAWDPNPEPNVVYVVYWGTQSLTYTSSATSGTNLSYVVNNLVPGQKYYFAVQARSADGLTSPYSEEVSTTIPAATPTINTLSWNVTGAASTGSTITWSASATGGSGPLEYKFLLYTKTTDSWQVIQDYSTTSTLSWTPTQPGTYALQVWVRAVGSTATYEAWRSTGYFDVATPAVHVTSLTAQPAAPVRPGDSVRFTAVASGGSGTLNYAFWLLDTATGVWSSLRGYAADNQVTWTAGAVGRYAVQVWVRDASSSKTYDAWLGNATVRVTDKVEVQSLTPNVAGPVSVGTPVTWSAVAGGAANIEYSFWAYRAETNQWSVLQQYGPSSSVVWAPSAPGTYGFQVWARQVGSSQPFDDWKPAGPYQVTAVDPGFSLDGVTINVASPILAGTNVTVTARATLGSAPVEFRFWIYDGATGQWRILQDYSTSTRATWTPTAAGDYGMQVWARRVGSAATYESWKPGPNVVVSSATVTVSSVSTTAALPASVGASVPWTVVASSSSGAALEFQFWLQDGATGNWTVLQPWSTARTATWVPARAGTYSLQVWARTVGASVSYEGWKGVSGIVVR
jgi:hypothetical protein